MENSYILRQIQSQRLIELNNLITDILNNIEEKEICSIEEKNMYESIKILKNDMENVDYINW